MFCLVYRSKANPNFGGPQIFEMLEKARKSNQQNNITGCLLCYGEQFIQYLEGGKAEILGLFERIQNDMRHSNVTLLSMDEIEEREFDTWDMAFENLWGSNSQLQYLKLLVSSYMDDSDLTFGPNPTSLNFWQATKKLLKAKRTKDHF